MSMKLSIANAFSRTPGARKRCEGPCSGEAFLQEVLVPAWQKAHDFNAVLVVDLDGTYGYSTGFLEEAFGGLSRWFGTDLVLQHLVIQSSEEPHLVDEVLGYLRLEL